MAETVRTVGRLEWKQFEEKTIHLFDADDERVLGRITRCSDNQLFDTSIVADGVPSYYRDIGVFTSEERAKRAVENLVKGERP